MFVVIRSFVDLKAHVFIKAFGKRVLLIDRQLTDGIRLHSVAKQPFPQALPPFLRGEEQHGELVFLHAHKADGKSLLPFRDNQVGDARQRLRDVFFDLRYVAV